MPVPQEYRQQTGSGGSGGGLTRYVTFESLIVPLLSVVIGGCSRAPATPGFDPAHLDLISQQNGETGGLHLTPVSPPSACILRFRHPSPGLVLDFPWKAADIRFGNRLTVPGEIHELDGRTFAVGVPMGYGELPGTVKCTLKWLSPANKETERSWILKPLPRPHRYAVNPKADKRVRASFASKTSPTTIRLEVDMPELGRSEASLYVKSLTFVPYRHWATRTGSNFSSFEINMPFAGDQDAAEIEVTRDDREERTGFLKLPSCRLITEGGKAFLQVPRTVSLSPFDGTTVAVPAQLARLFRSRSGSERILVTILKCEFAASYQDASPHGVGATFTYLGPGLDSFGLAEVRTNMPDPRVRNRFVRKIGPLKVGELPELSVRFHAWHVRNRHVLGETIPIERR